MKEYRYEINNKTYRVRILELYGDRAVVQVNEDIYQVAIHTAAVPDEKTPARPAPVSPAAAAPPSAVSGPKPAAAPAASPGLITAPMPGVILKVLVEEGDMVNAGDPVMVIEAMKMENQIKAPISGTVKKIMVEAGESVNTGEELMEISP